MDKQVITGLQTIAKMITDHKAAGTITTAVADQLLAAVQATIVQASRRGLATNGRDKTY